VPHGADRATKDNEPKNAGLTPGAAARPRSFRISNGGAVHPIGENRHRPKCPLKKTILAAFQLPFPG
jgi:hypothetical protein